jgi:ABC-type nitrate/sulfonate/bicarbonate transport system permease component
MTAGVAAPTRRSRGSSPWVVRTVAVVLVAGAWELIGRTVDGGVAGVLPSISEILAAWLRVVQESSFLPDVAATLQEIGSGFAIGAAAGLLAGVLIGASPWLTRVLEPMLFWASGVPKIVLLPILLSLLGAGIALKAGHAALSSFFPVTLGTATAIKTMPPIYRRVAQTSGASRLQTVLFVYSPAAAGQILTALRLGLGVAIVSALLAETSVATAGVGWRAIEYYEQLRIPEMYALILTIFVAAMVVNVSLERLISGYTRHFDDGHGR